MSFSSYINRNDLNSTIYYNARIENQSLIPTASNPTPIGENIPAKFLSVFDQPILDNPSDYYLSVIRYSIPQNIPIFIFPQANPSLVTGEKYSVTLSFNGFDAQQFLVYQPLPVVSPYGNPIYGFQQFLDMLNTALAAAFVALQGMTALPAGVVNPPVMVYNPADNLFSLIVDENYAQNVLLAPTVQIYFSNAVIQLFDTFTWLFYGYNTTNGKDALLIIESTFNNWFPTPYPKGAQTQLIMTQEISSIYAWSSLRRIIMTSNTIPIVKELTGVANGSAIYLPVLTDFDQHIDIPSDYVTDFTYVPNGPYRLVELQSTTPMRSIDFALFIQDRNLNLFPILIQPGQEVSIKLLFIKKSIYNLINAGRS